MKSRLLLEILRLRERLWARPALYCFFAIFAVFVARWADFIDTSAVVPEISQETIEKLLTIISSTMLAVATFAVGAMLSAYGSASSSATPRAFALVLSDDVSQSALSSFVGAFIFSIVSIIALKTDYYGLNGNLVLFVMTLAIFAWVILTFVRWVDSIARLGRIGTTINMAEAAAAKCLQSRKRTPYLGGNRGDNVRMENGAGIFLEEINYLQFIDMARLQSIAESVDGRIAVDILPGAFIYPGRCVARIDISTDKITDEIVQRTRGAFITGDDRTFEADPRFGLIVLSEIASRALSAAVNDPGTAVIVIGRFVRLFSQWCAPLDDGEARDVKFDRIYVPALSEADMFDDAFTAIARDGAGIVEVGLRLQKAFASLASLDSEAMKTEARRHSRLALERAEHALHAPDDINKLRSCAVPAGS